MARPFPGASLHPQRPGSPTAVVLAGGRSPLPSAAARQTASCRFTPAPRRMKMGSRGSAPELAFVWCREPDRQTEWAA